jgi:hypothetical protein
MNHNLVHKNILKFALEEVSLNQFELWLGETSSDEPMYIWWRTNEGNNRRYTMYWNPSAYVGTEASLTKEDNDMYNLQGDYPGGWRTLDTLTVSRFRFRERTYIVE